MNYGKGNSKFLYINIAKYIEKGREELLRLILIKSQKFKLSPLNSKISFIFEKKLDLAPPNFFICQINSLRISY